MRRWLRFGETIVVVQRVQSGGSCTRTYTRPCLISAAAGGGIRDLDRLSYFSSESMSSWQFSQPRTSLGLRMCGTVLSHHGGGISLPSGPTSMLEYVGTAHKSAVPIICPSRHAHVA